MHLFLNKPNYRAIYDSSLSFANYDTIYVLRTNGFDNTHVIYSNTWHRESYAENGPKHCLVADLCITKARMMHNQADMEYVYNIMYDLDELTSDTDELYNAAFQRFWSIINNGVEYGQDIHFNKVPFPPEIDVEFKDLKSNHFYIKH